MLSQDQVRDMLSQTPLFGGCSNETLVEIAKLASEGEYEKGQVIYEPGDKASDVYLLVDGIVTFINKSGLEFLNVQRVMKRSMVFGWVALVPEHPTRLGTAQCLEDSIILSINGDKVLALLDKDTESGYRLMKQLSSMIASNFVNEP